MEEVRKDLYGSLRSAARASGRGTPHPGSFGALVRIYETIAAEALAGGGTDPVAELERRKLRGSRRLWWALASIFDSDRAGRGADYLLAVLAASEPPKPEDWPRGRHSLWCDAAQTLRGTGIPPEENPRRAELPETALDDDVFYQLCGRH